MAMATITRLVIQAKDPSRVSVFLDEVFAFGISQTLEAASAEEIEYERVLRLLAIRSHARAELLRKLTARGVSKDVAQRAVDRAAAEGYVDDAQFAREFAQHGRDVRAWAPARARLELRRRGVATENIDSALEAVYQETDLFEAALKLARARAPKLTGEREAMRRRLAAYLSRRGFTTDICLKAVDEVAP